jgi:hypothetical protein
MNGERRGRSYVFCKMTTFFFYRSHSDFVSGLPTTSIPSLTDHDARTLTPADRLRLIHKLVTSTTQEGGLGIISGTTQWDLVESVMVLRDHKFNENWIHSWTHGRITDSRLSEIRAEVCRTSSDPRSPRFSSCPSSAIR